jgi:hypothetical protein
MNAFRTDFGMDMEYGIRKFAAPIQDFDFGPVHRKELKRLAFQSGPEVERVTTRQVN